MEAVLKIQIIQIPSKISTSRKYNFKLPYARSHHRTAEIQATQCSAHQSGDYIRDRMLHTPQERTLSGNFHCQ